MSVKQALNDINNGMSISQAAKKYDVNKGTLSVLLKYGRVIGDPPVGVSPEQKAEPTITQNIIKFVLNGLGFVAILLVLFLIYTMFLG